MKRTIVAFLLVISTVFAIFGMVSCGNEGAKTDGTTDKSDATTAAPADTNPSDA